MSLDAVTTVLAIRHGETAWNADTRIQGHIDIPLNERGLAQARLLAEALAGEQIDAVYSSDLQRAQQTAAALASSRELPLNLDARLRERHFGVFEGLTWAEIEARHADDSARWRRREPDFAAPGGESLQDFFARAVAAVERIALAHPGQTIAIVAHGGVMDCLYRAASRQPLQAVRTWKLGNAAVNRLLWSSEGPTLVGWNDDMHLDGLDNEAEG